MQFFSSYFHDNFFSQLYLSQWIEPNQPNKNNIVATCKHVKWKRKKKTIPVKTKISRKIKGNEAFKKKCNEPQPIDFCIFSVWFFRLLILCKNTRIQFHIKTHFEKLPFRLSSMNNRTIHDGMKKKQQMGKNTVVCYSYRRIVP